EHLCASTPYSQIATTLIVGWCAAGAPPERLPSLNGSPKLWRNLSLRICTRNVTVVIIVCACSF
ncbi:MAG: hypothetical protein V7K21_30220, partial [Nostoc sp.]|uniref:hypothetical protein n=1 Tax=Nostoc sp. TaxID=1180 RepID=UPI002FF7F6F7